MPMAVRYSATKPMFLSLVRPERISSPMTKSPAVTIAVSLSDLPSAAPVMAASPPSWPPLARHATRLKHGVAALGQRSSQFGLNGFSELRFARVYVTQSAGRNAMNFSISERQKHWRDRVIAFMEAHVYPAVEIYDHQDAEGPRWKVIPILEELKAKAKAEGLWNLFLPPSPEHDQGEYHGAGLSNLDYALCSEQMGRVSWGSEVFNCSAPDTGNMEVLHRYALPEQKAKWLKPLLNGEIRSAFLMTEPAVASSDATNIETSIVRDGSSYVINGLKWWSSGVGDPRCKIYIVMGKTDPGAAVHQQQSQVLVPSDPPGIKVERVLRVFGFADAPHGHAEVRLDNVRVPVENVVLGEGRGF